MLKKAAAIEKPVETAPEPVNEVSEVKAEPKKRGPKKKTEAIA